MADAGSPGSASPGAHRDPQPSVAEVQTRILEQLQAARAVLTAHSTSGSLPKDELAEVLEELSHSTALLTTVKRDLDSMFGRLRRTRAALAAAFPRHAVAPRRVVHAEEEEAAALRLQQGGQQQQGKQGQQGQQGRAAVAEAEQLVERHQEQQEQQELGQQCAALRQQVEAQAAEQGAAGAAFEVLRQGSQLAEPQYSATDQQQTPVAQAAQQEAEAAERGREAPPRPPPSG